MIEVFIKNRKVSVQRIDWYRDGKFTVKIIDNYLKFIKSLNFNDEVEIHLSKYCIFSGKIDSTEIIMEINEPIIVSISGHGIFNPKKRQREWRIA